jgi:hypothetical protein
MNLKSIAIVATIVLSALAGGFAMRAYEQSQCDKRVAADAERAAAENARLRAAAEEWAGAIASRQGESVLRSFAAGLTPMLLAERDTALDIAGASLLRLDGVQGISILRADGKTLYASDAKLTVSDAGNEQTRWALGATDFAVRDSVRPGVIEMALPVADAGRSLAVVWLSFDSNATRDQGRPAALASATTESVESGG